MILNFATINMFLYFSNTLLINLSIMVQLINTGKSRKFGPEILIDYAIN